MTLVVTKGEEVDGVCTVRRFLGSKVNFTTISEKKRFKKNNNNNLK
jgi:hypothetical protein